VINEDAAALVIQQKTAIIEWIESAPPIADMLKPFIVAILYGRPEGVSEEELARLHKWLQGVLTDLNILSLLLAGGLAIKLDEGKQEPDIRILTPK